MQVGSIADVDVMGVWGCVINNYKPFPNKIDTIKVFRHFKYLVEPKGWEGHGHAEYQYVDEG